MRKILLATLAGLLIQAGVYAQTPGSRCDSMSARGYELFKQRNYAAAIPFLAEATHACGKDTALSDYDYYSLLALICIAYYETGREDSALYAGEGAMKYFEKIKAYNDPAYIVMLGRLALVYEYFGKYENAISAFKKCIAFYEKKRGLTHEITLEYAIELGACYSLSGDIKTAMMVNRELFTRISNSIGKNNKQYINLISNMGNDFLRLEMYDSAMIFHAEGVRLRGELMGTSDFEYAKGLGMLAQVYNGQNRFADAVILFERARDIFIRAGLSNSHDYSTLLNNVAVCYKNLSKLDKALQYLEECLRIKRKLFGNYHFEVAQGVNNVGLILEENFQYQTALEAYRHSKHIFEKLNSTQNPQYASVVTNLANLYATMGQYDSALHFFKTGLALKEKIYGQDHLSIASTLNNIASFYTDIGRYAEAETAYKRSAGIMERAFGRNALQLATVNQNFALLYKARGEPVKADSLLQVGYHITSRFIMENTEGLSENDKEGFAQDLRFNQYAAMTLRKENDLPNGWIYNSSLFYKGLLLEGARGFSAAFRNLDAALSKKAAEYLTLKKTVGVELLKPESFRSKDLPQLITQAAALERELLKASAGFRNWKDQFNVSWNNIQKQLKTGEAAIEFLLYYPPGIKTQDSALYAAMVLSPGKKDPVIVPLFYEAAFNRLISRSASTESVVKKLYRSTIRSSGAQPTAADSLYHLLWKPLLPYLAGIKTIYFAADGVINNINLAAIITPGGKRLIEDHAFVQLSSTRNMLKPAVTPTFGQVHLWGGVQYGPQSGGGTFTYLPGTLTEVNGIAAIAGKGRAIKTVAGAGATETMFKQLDGRSPEVLHIATHGFFFPDPSHSKGHDNRFAMAANPLLRSGLALAGANNNWVAGVVASDKEDGILTAYEIADMDLSNTKLVVLSACETGLGDIKSGEGVYGLQRAFKLAGVNYLIMSLWQVPDLETKEFMQLFYSKCFAGSPVRKAFRETQLEMNKKYQPYQWAAFVLVE